MAREVTASTLEQKARTVVGWANDAMTAPTPCLIGLRDQLRYRMSRLSPRTRVMNKLRYTPGECQYVLTFQRTTFQNEWTELAVILSKYVTKESIGDFPLGFRIWETATSLHVISVIVNGSTKKPAEVKDSDLVSLSTMAKIMYYTIYTSKEPYDPTHD